MRPITLLLVIPILLTASGCVRRTITVTSDPPGALVHINDEEVGRTPVTTGFLFYGVYDVRLELDGHQTLQTGGTAAAPWWDHIGLDLIAETGRPLVDVRWHYTLEPSVENNDADGLLKRAQTLRTDLNTDPPAQGP